ncbi:hypothetical protein W97_00535 [Coniosporium apollinis CBS 100218]|uniref:Hydrophobin n=1 Tax=Coniosporium apollinis (strain CBS 100218) TaxID=1168221 RepID=R7YHD9_CONA1|nr:uncharacterized protein W97_00535 [Coniosporium apollinis CBS 100218]EON61322.1 hypothetical protein W97_00535 [Coniosporium apollinis CBS 100218]
MHHAILSTLLLLLALAAASPPTSLSSFFTPILEASFNTSESSEPSLAHELLKRQSGCASGYTNCVLYGAAGAGLCCRPGTGCAVDQAGQVACCPSGAVCTGTIGPVTVPTTSTVNPFATSTSGFVIASTTSVLPTSTQGFIIAASTTVATIPGQAAGTLNRSMPHILQLLLAGWLFLWEMIN